MSNKRFPEELKIKAVQQATGQRCSVAKGTLKEISVRYKLLH